MTIARTSNAKAQPASLPPESTAEALAFQRYEDAIDREVFRLTGLSMFCHPDVPTRDWFDDDVSAKTAARRLIAMSREY